jgi:hypothetical protein
MKRQVPLFITALSLMIGSSFECHSALLCRTIWNSFPSHIISRKLVKDENISIASAPAILESGRILKILQQEEFKEAAQHLVQPDGNFINKTEWFKAGDSLMFGHEVSYRDATTNWLARATIATSKKIALPCAILNFIGTAYGLLNAMQTKTSNISHENDAILLNMNIVGMCSLGGIVGAVTCLHFGFNSPTSQGFILVMNQRQLIKFDKKYYYVYPQISAALQDNQSVC